MAQFVYRLIATLPPPPTPLSTMLPKLSTHASRNPNKPVQQPRQRNESQAQRNSRKEKATQRLEADLELEEKFKEIFQKREENITELAATYAKTENYIRQVLENSVRYTKKRAPSLKNAIAHDLSKKARENGDASNVRNIDLKGAEYCAYRDSLSEDAKAELIEQLVDSKDLRDHGVRATNKAVGLDASQTGNQVGKVVRAHQSPFAHWYVRVRDVQLRAPDDTTMPCYVDSDNARQFFKDAFKIEPLDLMRKFELWSVNRNKSNSNELHALRAAFGDLVHKGFWKITGKDDMQIPWANYKIGVVHTLGVELASWPKDIAITCPSKIPAADLWRLIDKLRDGSMAWVSLTKSQREATAVEVEELPARTSAKKNKKKNTKASESEEDEVGEDESEDEDEGEDKDDTSCQRAAHTRRRRLIPGTFAPVSSVGFRPQFVYDPTFDPFDFTGMDFDAPLDPFLFAPQTDLDFTNDGALWHINTSNRKDGWVNASDSTGADVSVGPVPIAHVNSGISAGYEGTGDIMSPPSAIPTGAQSSATSAGPLMMVFSVMTNTTMATTNTLATKTKKRKRAAGDVDGAEKPVRRACAKKNNEGTTVGIGASEQPKPHLKHKKKTASAAVAQA
ncbi:hypothetical protein B0H13DRAFT_2349175 [Mycena leptocephala]|nr:hypothetical protein B0H13DRAFT_2349175 [Mycena leptocephala]